jgi:hypothetical protein
MKISTAVAVLVLSGCVANGTSPQPLSLTARPDNVAPDLIASNHDSLTVDFKQTTPSCEPWTPSSQSVSAHQSATFTSTGVNLTCGAQMLAEPPGDPFEGCTLIWSGLGGQFLIRQNPSVTACNLVSGQTTVTFVYALAGPAPRHRR